MTLELVATASLAIRALLALIFLTAGAAKLRHLDAFGGVLRNYRLLPDWSVATLRVVLPLLEIGVGASIVPFPAPVTAIAAALLLLFAFAIAINLRRGRRSIDCGCHSATLRQQLSWKWVWRNVCLALLAAAFVRNPDEFGSLLIGVAAGLSLFLLYTAMSLLWALGSAPRRRRIRIVGASI